jgi:hypothetical protein
LLAWKRGAITARQQLETVGELGRQGFDRHCPYTSRREFDREREAIEFSAELFQGCGVLVAGVRRHRLRALDEERDRIGEPERWDGPRHLAREPERLATRGEDTERRTRVQQVTRDQRSALDQMLAIVEYEQRRPPIEELRDARQ